MGKMMELRQDERNTPLDSLIDEKRKEAEEALADYKGKMATLRELIDIKKNVNGGKENE